MLEVALLSSSTELTSYLLYQTRDVHRVCGKSHGKGDGGLHSEKSCRQVVQIVVNLLIACRQHYRHQPSGNTTDHHPQLQVQAMVDASHITDIREQPGENVKETSKF